MKAKQIKEMKSKKTNTNSVEYYVCYCERFGVDRQVFTTYNKDIFDKKLAFLKAEKCQIECIAETKFVYGGL